MTITVLVDVEACGASPARGEMTEFGAVALNRNMTAIQSTYHGILIEAVPDPTNPAKPLILPGAKRYPEKEVMQKFEKWLLSFGERVVFTSDNPGYDVQWLNFYFDKHEIANPFGYSSRRIGDFAAGLSSDWGNSSKWKKLRDVRHDHNPLNDSLGNGGALLRLIAMSRGEEEIRF